MPFTPHLIHPGPFPLLHPATIAPSWTLAHLHSCSLSPVAVLALSLNCHTDPVPLPIDLAPTSPPSSVAPPHRQRWTTTTAMGTTTVATDTQRLRRGARLRRRARLRWEKAHQGFLVASVDISYAQLKYEGFRKHTKNHCSILPKVFRYGYLYFTTGKP